MKDDSLMIALVKKKSSRVLSLLPIIAHWNLMTAGGRKEVSLLPLAQCSCCLSLCLVLPRPICESLQLSVKCDTPSPPIPLGKRVGTAGGRTLQLEENEKERALVR